MNERDGAIVRRLVGLEGAVGALLAQVRTPAFVYARAGMSTDVSVPNDTLTELAWGVVDTDTHGMVGGASITIPRDGVYAVVVTLRWAVNGTGMRRVSVRRYSGGVFQENIGSATANSDGARETDTNVIAIRQLASGEEIRIGALQNSGGTLNVLAAVTSVVIVGLFV